MTNRITVSLADLAIGMHVTAWKQDNGRDSWGQGGTVSETSPDVVLMVGNTVNRFPAARLHTFRFEREVPSDATECVNYGPDCHGAVDWMSVPNGSSNKRCGFHTDARWEQYENGIERYAGSAIAPSWFDPSYAGERWNEDD